MPINYVIDETKRVQLIKKLKENLIEKDTNNDNNSSGSSSNDSVIIIGSDGGDYNSDDTMISGSSSNDSVIIIGSDGGDYNSDDSDEISLIENKLDKGKKRKNIDNDNTDIQSLSDITIKNLPTKPKVDKGKKPVIGYKPMKKQTARRSIPFPFKATDISQFTTSTLSSALSTTSPIVPSIAPSIASPNISKNTIIIPPKLTPTNEITITTLTEISTNSTTTATNSTTASIKPT
ncbi:14130_t:CDS:2, partial [Entrophospora sp. SA101]